MRHGLTDEAWNVIEDLFPPPAQTDRPQADPHKMLNAMIWPNNKDAKWRDIPSDLGAWQTGFTYFDRWNSDGTLQAIVNRLTPLAIDKNELDGDPWCMDGSLLRAHRCAARDAKRVPDEPADHALGRSKANL